mgnify:CR=1 FL=1
MASKEEILAGLAEIVNEETGLDTAEVLVRGRDVTLAAYGAVVQTALDAALAELGWTAAEAGQIVAALKTERARRPDEPGRPPRPPKDSPFAALAGLNTTAPPRRRRPRKRAKPG